MQINEDITVDVSADGTPIRFIWRGNAYTVVSSPERWLTRRAWWTEPDSIARGSATGSLDVPVWRVDAAPLGATTTEMDGTFDLARYDRSYTSRVGWMLLAAWSDQLEERLFA